MDFWYFAREGYVYAFCSNSRSHLEIFWCVVSLGEAFWRININNPYHNMKFYQSIIALILTFAFMGFASAQSTSTNKVEGRRIEVLQKVRELKLRASSTIPIKDMASTSATSSRGINSDKMCANLVSRIDKRLNNFASLFERHKTMYDLHKEKLLLIVSKLEASGVSTTKLETDIATLETKLAKFESDKAKVQAALEDTKNFSCGESQGQFRNAVKTLKEAQKVLAADARDIHNFIHVTLKQRIIELRKEFKKENRGSVPASSTLSI